MGGVHKVDITRRGWLLIEVQGVASNGRFAVLLDFACWLIGWLGGCQWVW